MMVYDPDAIRIFYDEIAEQEDNFEKMHFLRNEIPREFIKKYLKTSDLVLDAGGGTGINAIMMGRLCQRVTLVDISPGILELAAINIRNAGLTKLIDMSAGDITHLEKFGDGTFSFVVCVGSVISQSLEKNHQAIRELVRVARAGSVLIIGFDSKYGLLRHYFRYEDDLLDEAIEIFRKNEYLNNGKLSTRLYTIAEAIELLKEAGCEILEVASTPVVINSLDESKYRDEEKWEKLKELELEACTEPELLGIGSQFLCVAKKSENA